jgi:hypothetical protein
MERDGKSAEYRMAYVIGSGSHASGYLIQAGGHLFQSPLCYYTNQGSYGLAPGYERLDKPDFTRAVDTECLVCHSGKPTAGALGQDAISCDRCHGDTAQHLRRPVPGSIVNPAKLTAAARDSVCEQCHLAGVTRILNPGREFADFRPGQRLEDVFTVYVRAGSRPFKVISHAEQLAQSKCARESGGRLWCGTCHDPHPAAVPTLATYKSRCEGCHAGKLAKDHPADDRCVTCHMSRRAAQDGGHTVFTDHRIRRTPEPEEAVGPVEDIAAWREPDAVVRQRNLALAYVNAGISNRTPPLIVRGYRMLTDVQKSSPDDVAVLRAIGRVLLLGKEPREALKAFDRVLALDHDNARSEEDAGVVCLEAGQVDKAASHLERALQLDPLLITAATALEEVYRKQGAPEKAVNLAERIERDLSKTKSPVQ